MGVLSREEREALTAAVSRRRSLWAMHIVKETLSEAPRTFNPGYPDHELLYGALTSGFDEAEATAESREELLERVTALRRRLETEYAVALRDSRARSEFDAMVNEMVRAIRRD